MTATNPAPPATEHRPKVLAIDDSADELHTLSRQLGQSRFRLSMATDGRTGYQKAVVWQPDIILLDIVMPNLDGFSTCRMLKADPTTQGIPIVFLTGQNSPHERLRGLQQGGVDYVAKPVLAEEVAARIFIHLNRTNRADRLGPPPAADAAPPGRSPDWVLFNTAESLIRDSLENAPTIPQLASMLGTHEKRLGQVFRNLAGMTVSAFINECRMLLARQLLEQTDMPIHGIAEQIGFRSAANFSTAFGVRVGMTPTMYRQHLRRADSRTVQTAGSEGTV